MCKVWILEFGDFGFWGSWILDFGLGILDGHLVTKFWMLHKKRSCARRPGSADYHILYIICPKMIHLCFPYDFLGALIFHPISTTPGRCCYWRGATDATCTATCHGGQPWAKAVLVRDALFENVNVDFLFQPKLSTNLWNTVYFQHFLFGDQIGSGYQTTQSISYLEVW